jgi:hypothetical protein
MSETILGTAREALENHGYSKLEEKYGKEGAEAIITPQLTERGISIAEFRNYRTVKKVIQNNGLDIAKAKKVAEEEAARALNAELA